MIWTLAALASITLPDDVVVGEEIVLALEDDSGKPIRGETVTVVHHPNTAREREMAINISDGRGQVAWIPAQAGLAELQAGSQSERVVITNPQAPRSAGLMLVLICLFILGGLVYGLTKRSKV